MLNIMLKNTNCCQTIMLLYVIVHEEFTACSTLSHGDCSIRVYQLFTTIFYKCLILLVILILHSYYAGIMLNAFSDPCSKLCCHNRRVPTLQYAPCIQPYLRHLIIYDSTILHVRCVPRPPSSSTLHTRSVFCMHAQLHIHDLVSFCVHFHQSENEFNYHSPPLKFLDHTYI